MDLLTEDLTPIIAADWGSVTVEAVGDTQVSVHVTLDPGFYFQSTAAENSTSNIQVWVVRDKPTACMAPGIAPAATASAPCNMHGGSGSLVVDIGDVCYSERSMIYLWVAVRASNAPCQLNGELLWGGLAAPNEPVTTFNISSACDTGRCAYIPVPVSCRKACVHIAPPPAIAPPPPCNCTGTNITIIITVEITIIIRGINCEKLLEQNSTVTRFLSSLSSEIASVPVLAQLGITEDFIQSSIVAIVKAGRRREALAMPAVAGGSGIASGAGSAGPGASGRGLLQIGGGDLAGDGTVYVKTTIGPFGPNVTQWQADDAVYQIARMMSTSRLFSAKFKEAYGGLPDVNAFVGAAPAATGGTAQSPTQLPTSPASPPPLSPSKKSSPPVFVYAIGAGVGAMMMVFVGVAVFVVRARRTARVAEAQAQAEAEARAQADAAAKAAAAATANMATGSASSASGALPWAQQLPPLPSPLSQAPRPSGAGGFAVPATASPAGSPRAAHQSLSGADPAAASPFAAAFTAAGKPKPAYRASEPGGGFATATLGMSRPATASAAASRLQTPSGPGAGVYAAALLAVAPVEGGSVSDVSTLRLSAAGGDDGATAAPLRASSRASSALHQADTGALVLVMSGAARGAASRAVSAGGAASRASERQQLSVAELDKEGDEQEQAQGQGQGAGSSSRAQPQPGPDAASPFPAGRRRWWGAARAQRNEEVERVSGCSLAGRAWWSGSGAVAAVGACRGWLRRGEDGAPLARRACLARRAGAAARGGSVERSGASKQGALRCAWLSEPRVCGVSRGAPC